MDERSQHGHPLPQQAVPHPGQSGMPAPAPWPTYAAPQHGAPRAGHAPYPGTPTNAPQPHAFQQPPAFQQQLAYQQQPHAAAPQAPNSQQFQYAPQGYVLPGAVEGHPAPMSAHGGTIGMPQQSSPAHSMPVLNGGPHLSHGNLAVDPNAQPQAWAFPTPQGMQVVQSGAAAHLLPVHASTMAHSAAPRGRRRLRWETIVPAAAVACLVASIAFFISDFDKITGRDAGDARQVAAQTPEATDPVEPATGATSESAEVVAQATELLRTGRFDDAANLLDPVLDVDAPDPAAVALQVKVDAASKRNDALLKRLATQRRSQQWTGVITTIGQLEQLRPLSKDLTTLRANARKAAKSASAAAQATRLMSQGRYSQAMTVVERALKAGPNRQLQALREQISARQAAPSVSGGAAGSRGSTPPASGGRGTSGGGSTTPRPPANVPASEIPAVPNVPNPTGGTAGTGAGAVGGGAGAGTGNCHTHEGTTSCHA